MDAGLEDRFRDHTVDAGDERLLLTGAGAVGGEQANVGVREQVVVSARSDLLDVLTDRLSRVQAVTDRHVEVHDDQVIRCPFLLESLLDRVDGLLAVESHLALDLVLVEDACERVRAVEVVFDDENFGLYLTKTLIGCPRELLVLRCLYRLLYNLRRSRIIILLCHRFCGCSCRGTWFQLVLFIPIMIYRIVKRGNQKLILYITKVRHVI